ncbi:hypothetical protein ASE72_18755 [Sphingomonas sp. Leaf20]|nr:hypothetical protein ASE72_18755 [Sphingomonas sp. Leaf20]
MRLANQDFLVRRVPVDEGNVSVEAASQKQRMRPITPVKCCYRIVGCFRVPCPDFKLVNTVFRDVAEQAPNAVGLRQDGRFKSTVCTKRKGGVYEQFKVERLEPLKLRAPVLTPKVNKRSSVISLLWMPVNVSDELVEVPVR